MAKNINCKHCLLNCKDKGKTECNKYEAIADRPGQLTILIRKALNDGNHELAKELQSELFSFNHG